MIEQRVDGCPKGAFALKGALSDSRRDLAHPVPGIHIDRVEADQQLARLVEYSDEVIVQIVELSDKSSQLIKVETEACEIQALHHFAV